MRVGISGASCMGKSTFVNDFINNWPMYKKPIKTYRDIIKEQNLVLNEYGTPRSQKIIMNALIDEVQNSKKDDFTIFDRCIWDNLVYTMWLNGKNRVDDTFVKDAITITKETLSLFDIIFFLPITKYSPIKLEESENRSVNEEYRQEIDNIFKALLHEYHLQSTVYFPINHKLGCPAIIEIFGNPLERIELAKMYLNTEGRPFSEKESLLTT